MNRNKIELDPNDIKYESVPAEHQVDIAPPYTFCGIQVTHIPTTLKASCGEFRSQHKNRDKALGVLNSLVQLEGIIASGKPVRRNGQLLALSKLDDGEYYLYPYGGGTVTRFDPLDIKEIELAEHPTDGDKEHAYLCLGNFICQGYVNSELKWNGWAVPCFTLAECAKLIKLLEKDSGVKFRRNSDDNGYYFVDKYNDPDDEIFCSDCVINIKGVDVTVNYLADGWTWEVIHPQHFEEINLAIKSGSMLSTVSSIAS